MTSYCCGVSDRVERLCNIDSRRSTFRSRDFVYPGGSPLNIRAAHKGSDTASLTACHSYNQFPATCSFCMAPPHRTGIVRREDTGRCTLSLRLRHGSHAFVALIGLAASILRRHTPCDRQVCFLLLARATGFGWRGQHFDWLASKYMVAPHFSAQPREQSCFGLRYTLSRLIGAELYISAHQLE